jgi:hypothetical protein
MAASEKPDDEFFDRADEHIHLANEQCRRAGRGKVSASFLYGASRFNAWNSACNSGSRAQLQDERDRVIDYFVGEYRKMLAENLDDYITNYDSYMQPDEA